LALGFQASSTGSATITGIGSTWTNNNNIVIGGSGSGVLNIEAGGTVNSILAFVYLGYDLVPRVRPQSPVQARHGLAARSWLAFRVAGHFRSRLVAESEVGLATWEDFLVTPVPSQ
jgi:T5SS/PEP-CTERM-associated repeat protein